MSDALRCRLCGGATRPRFTLLVRTWLALRMTRRHADADDRAAAREAAAPAAPG